MKNKMLVEVDYKTSLNEFLSYFEDEQSEIYEAII